MLDEAHAFWLSRPGRGDIRPVALPEPGSGDVVVRTLRSRVSRGTETLVFRGDVPRSRYVARGVQAKTVRPRSSASSRTGSLAALELDGRVVRLHESRVAWASYEWPL